MKKVLLAVLAVGVVNSCMPATAGTGKASWYGPGFHGKRTASGEIFDQNAMTTAHNSLPFGTVVKVTHKDKSVNVRVNDTGGFGKYGRTFDLSKGAARAIGCTGVCVVQYDIVGRPKNRRSANQPRGM